MQPRGHDSISLTSCNDAAHGTAPLARTGSFADTRARAHGKWAHVVGQRLARLAGFCAGVGIAIQLLSVLGSAQSCRGGLHSHDSLGTLATVQTAPMKQVP